MFGPVSRSPLAPAWIGLDLGGFRDGFDVEHRVLSSIDDLGLDVDHVVTHEQTGVVPRASAVLRVPEGAGAGTETARRLHRRLGGTVVILAPVTSDQAPTVLGHPGSAWDCLWAAAMTRDGLAGRCVRFPGQSRLIGVLTVRRVLARSAITKVTARGRSVGPTDLVDARDELRPVFDGGHLVLRVDSSTGGILRPDPLDAHLSFSALD